jgi:hypothetical protein
MGHLAVSFDGHRKHIVAHSLNIDSHHSLILLDGLGRKLNLDEPLRFLRDNPTLRTNLELILQQLVLAQYLQIVSELHGRGILQDNALLILEIVTHLSEVNLRLGLERVTRVHELESRSNDVAKESHLQVPLRPLQMPSELLFELARNRTLELDLE